MLGSELLLSTQPMPWRVVTQGAGQCLRVEAKHFRALVAQSLALRTVCQRYLMVRLQQLSRAAACERFHTIGPRLARWLLMSHDRARADMFPVTHVFLALMLGVRRVGVTAAAGALQRQGLIAYRRGELTVVDRPALERAACSCYRADCATYQQLMPKRSEPSRV
jgi:CRP-like cAMP-binding protein